MRSNQSSIYGHTLSLVVLDMLLFVSAFVLAVHLRFYALSDALRAIGLAQLDVDPWTPLLPLLPLTLVVWLLALVVCDAHSVDRRRDLLSELGGVLKAIFLMSAALLSVTFFYRDVTYSRAFAVVFIACLVLLTLLGRVGFRVLVRHVSRDDDMMRIFLVGAGPVADHLVGSIEDGLKIVGVLDDRLPIGAMVGAGRGPGVPVVGRVEQLGELARSAGARRVIVTDATLPEPTQRSVAQVCLAENLEWSIIPVTLDLLVGRASTSTLAGFPVVSLRRSSIRGFNRLFKRLFDILGASIMLIALSPLMAVVALLIKLTSRGPVLFTQERIGENGRSFAFLKFRSMNVDADDRIHREYTRRLITQGVAHDADHRGAVYKITSDPRLTPIGAFIRRYSIDELPQLLNVLRGDMSLIGPRPPIPYEVEAYRDWHKRRFEAPPGITGLWQVSGRSRLTFEEMVALDIEYLENWTFTRDLRILWQTMGVVLFDRAH